MSLSLYRKKRNFKNTPEPEEGKGSASSGLSFVVHRHDASHLHYDFRLEMEGVLKSWAVPKGPSMKPGEKRQAVMVEDHPLPYGKFYGEIPKGNYGAGTVDIWDRGTYQPLMAIKEAEAEKVLLGELAKGDLKIVLNGTHLRGAFALVRMKDGEEKNWLLIKKQDEFVDISFDIKSIEPVVDHAGGGSWKSKRPSEKQEKETVESQAGTVDDLEKAWKKLQNPMLAKLVSKISNSPDWIYEMKYDGYRAVTKIVDGKVEMLSRNGNRFNKQYAPLIEELSGISDSLILDGEVVIEDEDGISNFQLLQNYTTTYKGVLKYYVFDLLFVNGHTVANLPLAQRKQLLDAFFENNSFQDILKSDYIKGKGEELFKTLSAKGYEGIIGKDSAGAYLPGKRGETWVKVKNVTMQEVIICGYTLPQNSRMHFGSLILGIYKGSELQFIGNCGTGFTEASLKELYDQFQEFKTNNCPFETKPVLIGTKGKPVWLKPGLVCQVKFLAWTADERLRNPVFIGLREDKESEDVINEMAAIMEPKDHSNSPNEKILKFGKTNVKCTNLNKVYWPDQGITKGELIAYYQSVSRYFYLTLKTVHNP